jgi:replication factor A1
MDKTVHELYILVKDRMDKETFESEIKKRAKEYEGLLSEDAVAYLIADEQGANIAETAHISGLNHGDSANLAVQVEAIGKVREFSRKNGSRGQVVNVTISDDTGQCRLTLWDREVEHVRDGQITSGSRIRIINGYVKVTDFGVEINLGRWGSFFVE